MKIYLRDGRAPVPMQEATSRIMSANKGKNTNPEILLRKGLWQKNVKGYRLHPKRIPGRPDIAFIHKKIAIFINGCFWHRCPHCKLPIPNSNSEFWENKFQKNLERDKRKIRELKKLGWKTITVWECQMKKDSNKIVEKLKRKLS
ncbi:MAG: very short patch repair endonuclease [Ginsengibacter sp.]